MPLPGLLHRLKTWRKTRGKTATGLAVYRNTKTGTVRTNKGTEVEPNLNKPLNNNGMYASNRARW